MNNVPEYNSEECGNATWKQKRTVVAVVVISVFLLLSVATTFLVQQYWILPHREFDPLAWRDETKVQQGCRLEMADSLIEEGTLYNKTRAEVIELLGEPPKSGYFKDWDLVYRLGNERGLFSIDSEWLVVRLDAKGRVAEYRIVRD
ncbi:MAG: hypothetical protein ABSE63_12880 [Thermoguttaceae bacterium]|jgi:hypothetical protein